MRADFFERGKSLEQTHAEASFFQQAQPFAPVPRVGIQRTHDHGSHTRFQNRLHAGGGFALGRARLQGHHDGIPALFGDVRVLCRSQSRDLSVGPPILGMESRSDDFTLGQDGRAHGGIRRHVEAVPHGLFAKLVEHSSQRFDA